jgi:hypothetical protein
LRSVGRADRVGQHLRGDRGARAVLHLLCTKNETPGL